MVDTAHVDLLALIGQKTSLKRHSNTGGGEYVGPCPFCGTGENRFHVWPHGERPRFWCRQCGAKGDAISYLMKRDGIGFKEACRLLEVEANQSRPGTKKPTLPKPNSKLARTEWEATASPEWQREADAFIDRAFDSLHTSAKGGPGRDYLQKRGLSKAVTSAHRLGYNPKDYEGQWGNAEVYIPARSIILPWEEYTEHWVGETWVPAKVLKVKYRCIDRKKFGQATGGAEGLYGMPFYRPGRPIILVEGEICALSIWQAAPGLAIPLATGSADGARLYHWVAYLALASQLILAFDADKAGDDAARWWQTPFPNATRHRPLRHDVNDMLTAGDDITAWLTSALSPPD